MKNLIKLSLLSVLLFGISGCVSMPSYTVSSHKYEKENKDMIHIGLVQHGSHRHFFLK